mmetsp:Transcript_13919/g.39395  ORF Transcript_13919/g.39395 Transcript_13919/m.39395 type:complete len:93 (-) Transcript_13919:34-312(-)
MHRRVQVLEEHAIASKVPGDVHGKVSVWELMCALTDGLKESRPLLPEQPWCINPARKALFHSGRRVLWESLIDPRKEWAGPLCQAVLHFVNR